jgi:hypothetical protein
MSSIIKPIERSYKIAKERGWDILYWAIDVHGTIQPGNYKDSNGPFYPYSLKVLKLLSDTPHIKLIFFTSTFKKEVDKLSELLLNKYDIKFDYLNENPEISNTAYGDYSTKFYFNVMLEDKAGFDPEEDWKTIYNYLIENKENLFKNIW